MPAILALCAGVALVPACLAADPPASSFPSKVREDARAVGHTVAEDSRHFGHVVAEKSTHAGHTVAEKSTQAGHAIANAARRFGMEVRSGAHEVRAAVTHSGSGT
ncbi:MAG: hypothetical protein JSR36_18245 [Proteobacteria bacterium]|nr:hypothetical protein [Pseudomonadota bacterium]